jgi:hypothetical protein
MAPILGASVQRAYDVAVHRLAAVDAQTFWMSALVPNDQFLLYAFAGVPDRLEQVLTGLAERAARCDDLRLRIVDDCALRYPLWVPGEVDTDQFAVHGGELDWDSCLAAVARLADDQLDPRVAAWRLHVFLPVQGAPGTTTAVTVAVLQISHALADGTRTADLAAWLFGRASPVAPIATARSGSLAVATVAAARTHRVWVGDIAAGRLAPPSRPGPPHSTNCAPTGARRVRTLLRRRSELPPGPTVTVSALVAIAAALDGYLADLGADPARLAAEVLLAKPGIRAAHNHFRNVGIDLHQKLAPGSRGAAIATQLQDCRARAAHPAMLAADRAFAATPAPLLRWGVAQFDPAVRSAEVTGATVVSSVNRGAADLQFGSAPVLWTSGYPALSPMMGLTHGVHGLGDTIALSVHGAESSVDVDEYVARLDHALG